MCWDLKAHRIIDFPVCLSKQYASSSAAVSASCIGDFTAAYVKGQGKKCLTRSLCRFLIESLQIHEQAGEFLSALRCYERAASLGHAPACASIAWMRIDGWVDDASSCTEAYTYGLCT
jgi:TPR repeat protein